MEERFTSGSTIPGPCRKVGRYNLTVSVSGSVKPKYLIMKPPQRFVTAVMPPK